jgi:nuclear transcription Y subunit beta
VPEKTVALQRRIMSSASPESSSSPPQQRSKGANTGFASDANIRNFAPVARIMKMALPENAKIAKEAKECMQECVSEFISFITSEGISPCPRFVQETTANAAIPPASEKCQQEKRKTVNGEDILFAMTSLGFENYAEALKIYLSRYREVSCPLFSFPVVPISFVA